MLPQLESERRMLPDRLLAVVLAGNDADPELLGGAGQTSKYFLPFGDGVVGDRIAGALDQSLRCRAISVALPPSACKTYSPTSLRPTVLAKHGPTRMASMASALDRARQEGLYSDGEFVVVVTGDLPLLTAGAVDSFVATCEEHPGADCYMGMVPLSAVDPRLHALVEREGLAFRGETCLHTDVYLLRPASMSNRARRRFDDIMSIRRTGQTTGRGFFKAVGIVLEIVGFRGLIPFLRVVAALRSVKSLAAEGPRSVPDRLESSVLDLIEEGFGLRLCLVPVSEPVLGLGVDYADDLPLLLDFDRALEADSRPPVQQLST